jgi:sulfoxide reductase heme-binding subunit YedZ
MPPRRRLQDSRPLLWGLLAIPALHILYRWRAENLWPDDLVAPSGEWAARLIIFTLMLSPLSMLLPNARPIAWLRRRRRAFGVAAFGYGLLHLGVYIAEMETVRNMLAEIAALGIWTGWCAWLLMLPLAATSNDAAARALGRGWKKLHRLAYPAALLTLVHWMTVHNAPIEALAQFAPLVLLELYRVSRLLRTTARRSDPFAPLADDRRKS